MTDDPLVMYLVVRKDLPLSFGRAMALAGAGAVACVDELGGGPAWGGAFARWRARPRKVALRASAEEMAAVAELDGVDVAAVLRCLPPRLRSESEPVLTALRPYTDGPRSDDEARAPAEGPVMTYVIRPGVLRTAGKAMAQAGHAALACVTELGPREPEAFATWRAAGRPGEVRRADDAAWSELRAAGAVVVRDAGLTQVAPDTETVLAFAPGRAPEAVGELELVA